MNTQEQLLNMIATEACEALAGIDPEKFARAAREIQNDKKFQKEVDDMFDPITRITEEDLKFRVD